MITNHCEIWPLKLQSVLDNLLLFSVFNFSYVVPSSPATLKVKLVSLATIKVSWEPPRKPRGQVNNIMYEIHYKEITASLESGVTISSEEDQIQIEKLKSNTVYIIKIKAGRHTDDGLQWSSYISIRARTLQKGRKICPHGWPDILPDEPCRKTFARKSLCRTDILPTDICRSDILSIG